MKEKIFAVVGACAALTLFYKYYYNRIKSKSKLKYACAGTWRHAKVAVQKAGKMLRNNKSAVDACEMGIYTLEVACQSLTAEQVCVGWRGNPRADGKMYYDAAIMEGTSNKFGAVLAMPRCRTPIRAARAVLDGSIHNVFVGEGALEFYKGWSKDKIDETDQLHPLSASEYSTWKKKTNEEKRNVQTGASTSPPPTPLCNRKGAHQSSRNPTDTVGIVCLDCHGNLAAATSTCGWAFAAPGRVGDAALIGSGIYVDNKIGAAVCTGDGEEIMKSVLAFQVVSYMGNGYSPKDACKKAIEMMEKKRKNVPLEKRGNHWNSKPIVAIVSINQIGETGAYSTINEDNKHYCKAANEFPEYFQWAKFDEETERQIFINQ
eukprot:g6156.t1